MMMMMMMTGSGDERTGCLELADLPCPLSCCAWPPSKHTSPQVKKWGPRPFNVCGNVINSSILAFAKKFDP